jgi:hypothetical protein
MEAKFQAFEILNFNVSKIFEKNAHDLDNVVLHKCANI